MLGMHYEKKSFSAVKSFIIYAASVYISGNAQWNRKNPAEL